MKNLLLAGFICLAAVLSTTEAQAQSIAKILSESGLLPQDFEIMSAQAATLYKNGNPRKGATTRWKNDASRSHGTVELVAIQQNCALLRHIVYPKGIKTAREIRMRRCKTTEGKWILQ